MTLPIAETVRLSRPQRHVTRETLRNGPQTAVFRRHVAKRQHEPQCGATLRVATPDAERRATMVAASASFNRVPIGPCFSARGSPFLTSSSVNELPRPLIVGLQDEATTGTLLDGSRTIRRD